MKYAYIFDFDGVLANTMPAHFHSYKEALHEFGVPVDRDQFYRQAGMTGREQIRYFAAQAGVTVDVEAVYARKREIHQQQATRATPLECNLELLRTLKAAGCRVGVASGSSRSSILPLIQHFEIPADAVVGAEDVQRGKPHPDLFLCASQRLGVPPADCIVIEDSDVGIESARAAGMRAMRFYDKVKERE